MFEMTFHVCYGNSKSIGIFAGNELRRSQLDHNWTIEGNINQITCEFG